MKTNMFEIKRPWITVFALLALLMVQESCEDQPTDQQPDVPKNLVVQITVAEDRSGNVDVVATADNVKYFNIYFGDGGNPTYTLDGTATHTYTASGSYEVKVQAHTAITSYIVKTEIINVTLKSGNDEEYTTPLTYDGMTLAWSDEFDGTELNQTFWTFETGGGGWGNSELEYYQKENTAVKDGVLTITAKKETVGGNNYTSSRIKTQGKKQFKFGRMDIRAKLPTGGKGIWPAIWMLGSNIGSVGWPKCGEIDIMENIGAKSTVYGTLHWDDTGGHACTCADNAYALTSGNFADNFHVFTLIWTETSIKWLVNDKQYKVIDITPAGLSELKESEFFIFNLAVGGGWPGNPDDTTEFPQRLSVDYIRVFQ
jgi:hypothetical protein